jgi:hypothetical protein
MTVVLFQTGSLRVVEATYFGRAFMRSLTGSPDMLVQTGTKPSYVRRPIRMASLASRSSAWIPLPLSEKLASDGQSWGFSITPSSVM